MEYDRSKLNFVDRTEEVWIIKQDLRTLGAVTKEAAVPGLVASKGSLIKPFNTEKVTLHRPSLQPIYGGPTLLEALWCEMDRLMEGLMTGTDAEDGGDRYRAQELAWVLAIVTNAYDPSVDRIRAEAVDRWNAQQDQEDQMTRPEGADQ